MAAILLHCLTLLALLGLPATSPAAAEPVLVLATGETTSKSFAVGLGLSTLAKVKLPPAAAINLQAVETAGFADNVTRLQAGRAQLALLPALVGHFARTGTGSSAGQPPRDDLRAIAMLWRDALHVIVEPSQAPSGTIADLAGLEGQPASFGLDAPGPIDANRLLLGHLGLDLDRYKLAFMADQASANALAAGRIVALSAPLQPPAKVLEAVLAGGRGRLLSFTDAQAVSADGGLGIWSPYVIPAYSYPNQDRAIQTVAQANLLVARADVAEAAVYALTKAVFEHLTFLRGVQDALAETSLEHALLGHTLPLHPGALRYYREAGLVGAEADLEVALADGLRAPPDAFLPTGALKAAPPAEPQVIETPAAAVAPAAPPAAAEASAFTVYFGLNETDLAAEARLVVQAAAAYAAGLPGAAIEVTGHADRAGDPAYNQALARRRAAAVLAALATAGAPPEQLSEQAEGQGAPAVASALPWEPRNRRVEIRVRPQAPAPTAAAPASQPEPAPARWESRAPI